MSFWDTVLGNHLAEVLIRTLPKIAEHYEEEEKTVDKLLDEVKALTNEVNELKYIISEKKDA